MKKKQQEEKRKKKMDLEAIEEFVKLAKKLKVTQLKYEKDDEKFSVSFGPTFFAESSLSQASWQSPGVGTGPERREKKLESTDVVEIKAPFIGTFYLSPAPEEAHYVKVGDRVEKGHILCIIEAMKIMNEIEAEVAGEIVEICVDNENYVEFGQVLFRIKS